MIIQRRSFLAGLGSLLAAPAIVHAGNLMPVRSIERLNDLGNVTIYVNAACENSYGNDGLSPLRPFRTLQEACRWQAKRPPFASTTIQLASGNYDLLATDPIIAKNGQLIMIRGDGENPPIIQCVP